MSGGGVRGDGVSGAGVGGGIPGPGASPTLDGAEAARALLQGVAVLPAGRDVVGVEGPDAASYLQGQCSQDVEAMEVGAVRSALLLSPQGKLQALVRIGRLADDRFVVDVDAGSGPAVVARLLQFRLRVKAEVAALADWRCVALRGPGAGVAAAAVEGAVLSVPEAHGDLAGVDLLGPGLVPPPGVPVLSAGAWEAARIEAGIPTMGAELDERTIPAEADLLQATVSFTKGCYTGQELVARLDARGNRVARHLRGLVLDPAAPAAADGGPAPGWAVVTGDAVDGPGGGTDDGPGGKADDGPGGKAVGTLTSVAWSWRLGRPVALAYVHRSVSPPAAAAVRPPDGRGPMVPAEVRALPLVAGPPGGDRPGGDRPGGPAAGR